MSWRRALLVQTAGHQDDGYENCEVRVDLWWVHVRYLVDGQCPAEAMLHRDFVKRIQWAQPEDDHKQIGFSVRSRPDLTEGNSNGSRNW